MSGRPELSLAVLRAIYAHAVEGYPEEVCGLILGARGAPDEARRCENRQNALHAEDPVTFPRTAASAYNFGASDLFFLDKSLRGPRPVQIIYHSHVNVGAYFSSEDIYAAAPDGELLYPVDYLVVDVQKDGVLGAKLFRFTDNQFIEIAAHGPI